MKRKKNLRFLTILALVFVVMLLYVLSMNNKLFAVEKSSLQPLLTLIARAESDENYNAYYGNASNKSLKFTKMSLKEVKKWQAQYIKDGSPSSAVGRYQIIDTTLYGLTKELNIDDQQVFDKETQDRLAIALVERRGVEAYINNKLSDKEFAANLAKEWAGLPKVIGKNPNESYYASDGLNQSQVNVNAVLGAVRKIQPKD